MRNSRREFVKQIGVGTVAFTIGGTSFGFNAKKYSQISGANERIRVAVVGVNSRGLAHIESLAKIPNVSITSVCDVDSKVADNAGKLVEKLTNARPEIYQDIRKLIENKDIDLITIATPDHWHTPMTILAVNAGKHVYVEKPCAHNLAEGEMLVELSKKFPEAIIQMGNQGRSGKNVIQGIKEIQEGTLGEVYFAKSWYTRRRGSIGTGIIVPVPERLNWDLWQGPAPRSSYKNNVVHYNWHWFQNWGTGEMGNNAIHQLDNCLWALGVNYPELVTSYGSRFHFKDDWEFCDTQVSNYKFSNGKQIVFESKSCDGLKTNNLANGSIYFGTKGSIQILPEDNSYSIFDLEGKMIKQVGEAGKEELDLAGTGTADMNVAHFINTIESIRGKEQLHSPIKQGVKANALALMANISQKVGRTLKIDQLNGKILDDKEAMNLSSREYEPGWEPKV